MSGHPFIDFQRIKLKILSIKVNNNESSTSIY